MDQKKDQRLKVDSPTTQAHPIQLLTKNRILTLQNCRRSIKSPAA
jgi:hypothetical protein